MNLSELLQIPAERDLPPGVAEARRRLLLSQIRDESGAEYQPARSVARRVVSVIRRLLLLASVVMLVVAVGIAGGSGRHVMRRVASVTAAGAAVVTTALCVSSRPDGCASARRSPRIVLPARTVF